MEHGLEVDGQSGEEEVIAPVIAQRGDDQGPERHRREDGAPRHRRRRLARRRLHLRPAVGRGFDEEALLRRDARMLRRRLVDEQQPQQHGRHGQTALDVERRLPAEFGRDVAAHREVHHRSQLRR